MKLTETQANDIFTILVEQGNMDASEAYINQKRFDFVQQMTTTGHNEYWFPTKNGSSMKIYFANYASQPISAYAQTLSTKDKGIVATLNAAFSNLR